MTTRDFLFEVGTEELPPKSLKRLMTSLVRGFTQELENAQLAHEGVKGFATPRRLAVLVTGLAAAQPEQRIEKRGPSVEAAFAADGAPTRAATGFAKSCGVDDPATLDRIQTDKGEWLVYREVQPGKPLPELIEPLCQAALRGLPIERAMRWGASRVEFVRPVHWIVMLHGKDVLPATLFEIKADRVSRGHRFMSKGDVTLKEASDYSQVLRKAHVIADFDERETLIREQIEEIGKQEKATVVIDPDLLEEVTALVEWPVALCGSFDPAFLDVPEEALISAMKSHQRYFHLVDKQGHLLPRFITISNLESRDPAMVIKGNERVITPRLADASFFFSQDGKTTLDAKLSRLKQVVFQSKLGTYYEKAERISKLAQYLAAKAGDDETLAARAGLLCKADLVTDMVNEFPELQGLMGRYYAEHDGEPEAVAMAIGEHYLPTHAGGRLPASRTGQCVAMADKLDTLTGLFGIGQPPTGSRDPFALRRQAIGVARICIECSLPIDINEAISHAASLHNEVEEVGDLYDYLLDRLTGTYQEQGIAADTVNAVRYSANTPAILTELDRQVRAVHAFRNNDRAASLVAANKRVANILKQVDASRLAVSPDLFKEPAERDLFDEIETLRATLPAVTAYEDRLLALANLQPLIDKYFDDVLVMDDDTAIRDNRLATLAAMRALFLNVADVSILQM